MATVSQAHDGFDSATTKDGGSVPTRFDRNLARSLNELEAVSAVTWSGYFGRIDVATSSPTAVIFTVASHFGDRHADYDLEVVSDETLGFRVLIDVIR